MPLPSPNLDNRNFEQLVAEAVSKIEHLSPEWTDRSKSDPGIVLLELFAYLTDTMIYRLNRLPDKVYIAFLNLLGVRLQPPDAAAVELLFTRADAAEGAVRIPRGTRVTTGTARGGRSSRSAGEAPVFVTDAIATIPVGQANVTVTARNCDIVTAELVGTGTGTPGLTVTARRPPIIAPTGDNRDLMVGVEATAEELGERIPAIKYEGKTYRLWTEVERFSNLAPDSHVYVADRMTGAVTFAPAARMPGEDGVLSNVAQALAMVPGAGREIRMWYWRGGGPEGNVAPNTLNALKDPLVGVKEVTNPRAATGGRAAETLANALIRGPQQLYALDRAVTAHDYELVARLVSGGIDRAKAITRAELWTYATPGTVELLLVPYLPETNRPGQQVTLNALHEHESDETRALVQRAIDERRPLGTTCLVSWARYKTVKVKARVVVRREENLDAVRARVVERLHGTINPLRTPYNTEGWPFGGALRMSLVYDVALKEPGVRYVDRVSLVVDEGPEKEVSAITVDPSQPDTWYVAAGSTLYRSLNDGKGWEPAGRFPGEKNKIVVVSAHAQRPGFLAVATRQNDANETTVHISQDCGETWQEPPYRTGFRVYDLAWTMRGGVPFLLLASDIGLHELDVQPGGSPVPVLVDQSKQDLGFYQVAVFTDVWGNTSVAVAGENTAGVYLSTEGGTTKTFRNIGLQGKDIRVLEVRRDGPSAYLWAGAATVGEDPGQGCASWQLLRGREDPPEGWVRYDVATSGWTGGTCWSIAFLGTRVLAATHRAGVLRLDLDTDKPKWQQCDVNCGLPLRPRTEPGPFYPVLTVAARQDPKAAYVMAGGAEKGVYLSRDRGTNYEAAARKSFDDRVMLPETWLFVSGDHEIEVVSEDEAIRD
jgi:hypothetical protein